MAKNPPSKRDYAEIDENLRRVFEELSSEQVPDRFTDLLDRLRKGDPPPGEGEGQG